MLNILIILVVGFAVGYLIGSHLAFEDGFAEGDQNGYIRRNKEIKSTMARLDNSQRILEAVKEYDPKRKRVLSATAAQDK